MPETTPFAFDLEGPLDLYGCGHCGSQDIEPYGATDIFCRNCSEITTPARWREWCDTRGIELTLGPFLQAVKDVKASAGLPLDAEVAGSRYLGESNADARRRALAGNRELLARYRTLTDRAFRAIQVEEL